MDGAIHYGGEYLVRKLEAVCRQAEEVADVGDLGGAALALVGEVAHEERLQRRWQRGDERQEVPEEGVNAVVNDTPRERGRRGLGDADVQSLDSGF